LRWCWWWQQWWQWCWWRALFPGSNIYRNVSFVYQVFLLYCQKFAYFWGCYVSWREFLHTVKYVYCYKFIWFCIYLDFYFLNLIIIVCNKDLVSVCSIRSFIVHSIYL
jgi:hypothetical protein